MKYIRGEFVINGERIAVTIIFALKKPKIFPGTAPPAPRRCSLGGALRHLTRGPSESRCASSLAAIRRARFARKVRDS